MSVEEVELALALVETALLYNQKVTVSGACSPDMLNRTHYDKHFAGLSLSNAQPLVISNTQRGARELLGPGLFVQK